MTQVQKPTECDPTAKLIAPLYHVGALTIPVHSCEHLGGAVECTMVLFTEEAGGPEFAVEEGSFADDLHNRPIIWKGDFDIPGYAIRLQKGIPTVARFRFQDKSNGTSTRASIVFSIRWKGVYDNYVAPMSSNQFVSIN